MLCYLLTSNLELEGLPPVPGAVNLLTVGQGQYIVAGHCLTSPTREILYTCYQPNHECSIIKYRINFFYFLEVLHFRRSLNTKNKKVLLQRVQNHIGLFQDLTLKCAHNT